MSELSKEERNEHFSEIVNELVVLSAALVDCGWTPKLVIRALLSAAANVEGFRMFGRNHGKPDTPSLRLRVMRGVIDEAEGCCDRINAKMEKRKQDRPDLN